MASSEIKKKYKDIRRYRVIPSVIGFLCSICFAVFFAFVILAVFSQYLLTERIGEAYKIDSEFASRVSSMKNAGYSYSEIVELMSKTEMVIPDFSIYQGEECLFLYGQNSFDIDKKSVFYDYYVILNDTENGLGEDFDDYYVKLDDVRKALSDDKYEDFKSIEDLNREVDGFDYWIAVNDSDGENDYYIKNHYELSIKDAAFCMAIFVLAIILVIFPNLSNFVNVISNAIHQGKVRKLLYMDQVTGGKNWLSYEDSAAVMMNKKLKNGNKYAYVDMLLLKYRSICACEGVSEGEELLREIEDTVRRNLDKKEFVSHYAKAEFSLFLIGSNEEELKNRIMAIQNQLSMLPQEHKLVFHSGIYFVDEAERLNVHKNNIQVSTMFNLASSARAHIDSKDANSVYVFENELLEQEKWEHIVEDSLDKAIANEEFKVYIQPKYNPVTNELCGGEALIRWVSDEYGFVPPYKFIPILEENGYITKIDHYMIDHVAKLQAQWYKAGEQLVPISVNVSRAHFAERDLAKNICEMVDKYGTPHKYIEIELTESAFFDDKEMLLKTVKELQDYGFEISMDDFGAGYSSLNSLKELPLDVLKLDAEFFRGDETTERGEIVVKEAINLAKNLDMRIVAEGIEKKEQVEFLADLGCDMIQGYYYAKPMPVDEYELTAFGHKTN